MPQLDSPPRLYPYLRFTVSLTVAASQDSGPSGSLVLSRKNFAFSGKYTFSHTRKVRATETAPPARGLDGIVSAIAMLVRRGKPA